MSYDEFAHQDVNMLAPYPELCNSLQRVDLPEQLASNHARLRIAPEQLAHLSAWAHGHGLLFQCSEPHEAMLKQASPLTAFIVKTVTVIDVYIGQMSRVHQDELLEVVRSLKDQHRLPFYVQLSEMTIPDFLLGKEGD